MQTENVLKGTGPRVSVSFSGRSDDLIQGSVRLDGGATIKTEEPLSAPSLTEGRRQLGWSWEGGDTPVKLNLGQPALSLQNSSAGFRISTIKIGRCRGADFRIYSVENLSITDTNVIPAPITRRTVMALARHSPVRIAAYS